MIGLSAYSNDFNDLKVYELRGSVKCCTQSVYYIENLSGKWQKGDGYGYSVINNFDLDGYVTKQEFFDPKGVFMGFCESEGRVGDIVEHTHYFYLEDKFEPFLKDSINYETSDTITFVVYDAINGISKGGKHYQKEDKRIKTVLKRYAKGMEIGGTTITFEYDNEGNMKEEKHVNDKGKIVFYQQYEYLEFDMNNNWTKRLIYEQGGEPQKIAIREIEYY